MKKPHRTARRPVTPAAPVKAPATAPGVAPLPATATLAEPPRRKLPVTRRSISHKFYIAGQKGYLTVGLYPDGAPGELFIVIARGGTALRGFADCWARCVSFLLQYGVPVSVIVAKFAWHRFEPAGHTPHGQIGYARSIVDYAARWLGYNFVPGYAPQEPK